MGGAVRGTALLGEVAVAMASAAANAPLARRASSAATIASAAIIAHEAALAAFTRSGGRIVESVPSGTDLVVDGVVGPQTRSALGLAPFSSSSVRSRSVSVPQVLQRIAACESGGNPSAVSPGGTYRGKYQFTRETWGRLGREGDPADAPEWLQDRMALRLYRQSGTAPWPSCA